MKILNTMINIHNSSYGQRYVTCAHVHSLSTMPRSSLWGTFMIPLLSSFSFWFLVWNTQQFSFQLWLLSWSQTCPDVEFSWCSIICIPKISNMQKWCHCLSDHLQLYFSTKAHSSFPVLTKTFAVLAVPTWHWLYGMILYIPVWSKII